MFNVNNYFVVYTTFAIFVSSLSSKALDELIFTISLKSYTP